MALITAVAVCILLVYIHTGEATSYNSTTACFKGSVQNPLYSATCDRNTTNDVGIIAVRRVFYGAQPDAHLCQDSDPASVCCSYTPDQDCLLPLGHGKISADVISGCSGILECGISVKKKIMFGKCPLPSLFQNSTFSGYSFMEYDCVNAGLLTDMCHEAIIKEQNELYINSNIYHTNTEHSDTSCTCKVTTSCGAAIIFEAVDIRLGRVLGTDTCIEELQLTDNEDSDTKKTITCLDQDLNAFTKIFVSESNSVTLNLTITGNHTGKLWIKMRSSWSNATVRLRCGDTLVLETGQPEHVCPEIPESTTTPIPTTTTTTTTTEATTTTTAETTTTTNDPNDTKGLECKSDSTEVCHPAGNNDILGLPTGAVAGIIVAGIIILLIIILILVLVFRRNRRTPDHIYDIPVHHNTDYETLHYHNPQPKPLAEMNSYDNPTYGREKVNLGGACPDYIQLDAASLPQYDNDLNDSIMVMPKGAVM